MYFFFSVHLDYMTYFHADFHGLKAASQSVLLFFINILLLGQKKQKKSSKA